MATIRPLLTAVLSLIAVFATPAMAQSSGFEIGACTEKHACLTVRSTLGLALIYKKDMDRALREVPAGCHAIVDGMDVMLSCAEDRAYRVDRSTVFGVPLVDLARLRLMAHRDVLEQFCRVSNVTCPPEPAVQLVQLTADD